MLRHGSAPQQEYLLTAAPFTFGREPANNLVLQDPEISRRHAQISFQEGGYVIQDLGSTNGTFVNGRRVGLPTPLHDGDVIFLANAVALVFYQPGAEERPSPAEAVTVAPTGMPPIATTSPLGQAPLPPPLPTARPAAPAAPQYSEPYYAPEPPVERGGRSWRRPALGCGCAIFLLVVLLAGGLFLLDAFAPDILYCDLLEAPLEAVGVALNCP
jgi:predicted component of type VI protein secretion system